MANFIRKVDVPSTALATAKAAPPPRAEAVAMPRHENRALASLPEADFALLARHLQAVTLPAGAVSPHQHLPLDHVYFPHRGLLSLMAMTSTGETIEVASAGRGGAICAITSSGTPDGYLAALGREPLRVSRVPAARLQALAAESDAIGRTIDACREALLLQLRQNLVCSGLHSVEHRLARWLLEAADRLETETIPAGQEQIAQRLGTRRTTVTLLASKLRSADAIRWGRSRVEIIDRARLISMACGCYAHLHECVDALLAPAAPAERPTG